MRLYIVKNRDEIKSIVRECFSTDSELIDEFHIKAGTSSEECIDDTCNVLFNQTYGDFEFYKILKSDRLIGFIGIEPSAKYLTTFCLKKKDRNEGNKKELFQSIIKLLGEEFSCALYAKNRRAIKYLIKQGMEISEGGIFNEHVFEKLTYKKEVLCH